MAGGNYGWPDTEGETSNPNYISPIHFYANQSAPECAIAGGTFYAPEVRQFPSLYVESYFFSDLCGGWIRRSTLSPCLLFATGISSVDQSSDRRRPLQPLPRDRRRGVSAGRTLGAM